MQATTKRQQLTQFILPTVLFYLIALPLILSGYELGRAHYDQLHFHLPVIQGFIQQLDFSDYHAATTPGYHAVMALIGRYFDDSLMVLQLFNSLITLGLILYLYRYLTTKFSQTTSLVLLLPVIFSIYILPTGVWLAPDNLSQLLLAWLMINISQLQLNKRHLITIAAVLALAVITRQTFIWLALLLGVAGLSHCYINQTSKTAWLKINSLILLTTLPAFLLLLSFVVLWQGLVPPSFQHIHQHISPSAPAFFFTLFAFYGLFYLPVIYTNLKQQLQPRWFILGACVGFTCAILVDSNYSIEAGRFSGFWNFVKRAPTIEQKSLLIILMSTIGAGLFFALVKTIALKQRIILLTASFAFIMTITVNQFVYERYYAGFIYILLFMILVNSPQQNPPSITKLLSPLFLALFNLGILIIGLKLLA